MADGNHSSSRDHSEYNSTLFLCFLATLGICLVFLPVVPMKEKVDRSQSEHMFIASKIAFIVIMIPIAVQALRFVSNRDRYHEAQVVFWPGRCHHCARALGIDPDDSVRSTSHTQSQDLTINETPSSQPSTSYEREDVDRVARDEPSDQILRRGYQVDGAAGSSLSYFVDRMPIPSINNLNANTQNMPVTSDLRFRHDMGLNKSVIPDLSVKHHRSLVNVFMIFSIISIIGTPLSAVGNLLCILENTDDLFLAICVEMGNLVILALIPISMKFAFAYYDAIFVTTSVNLYLVVVFLAGGIWTSVLKLVKPISSLLGSPYYDPGTPCDLNGTLANFLKNSEDTLTPIYTECAFIATCLLWEMWTSFVPRKACQLGNDIPRIIKSPTINSPILLKRIMPRLRRKIFRPPRGFENQRLFRNVQKEGLENCLFTTWVLSGIQSIAYFAGCLYFAKKYEASERSDDLFIAWSIEMAFILPFFIIYIHLRYISNPSLSTARYHSLQSKNNIGTHNIMLLLCSCGVFCQSIFRLSAAAGLLFTEYSTDPSDLALYILAVLYSIVIIGMTWQMTSFLMRVQKYKTQSHLEMKWNLVCLINVIVTNAMQWLIEIVVIEESPLARRYFGKVTGQVIGVLLNPFASLYGLHAAMMAYETYKTLLKRALDDD